MNIQFEARSRWPNFPRRQSPLAYADQHIRVRRGTAGRSRISIREFQPQSLEERFPRRESLQCFRSKLKKPKLDFENVSLSMPILKRDGGETVRETLQ